MNVTKMQPARALLSAILAMDREDSRKMPRYYFHLTDSVTVVDEVGLNLHGVGEALRHADRLEVTMRLSAPDDAEPVAVEITDEAGRLIGRQSVPFIWGSAL
jgi:hypothetical protein